MKIPRLFPATIVLLLALLTAARAGEILPPYNSPSIIPREKIVLFDGGDLSAFYTWLPKFGYSDPDRVFTVVDNIDGAPAIRISGQHDGGLITRANYANYRLVAEYRYGLLIWSPRLRNARDAGILLHGQGEDGGYRADFKSAWIHSIEYQIIEGGTGDLLLLGRAIRGSKDRISPRLWLTVTPGSRVWNPAGALTEFTTGRVDWHGRDPKWTNTLGFRGPRDVENPVGQWNRIEAICDGGNLTFFLNGVKVNEGRNGTLREGRLLFQSEGAEIYFRRIELHPISKPN